MYALGKSFYAHLLQLQNAGVVTFYVGFNNTGI